jgi:hypothetical protein
MHHSSASAVLASQSASGYTITALMQLKALDSQSDLASIRR